MKAIIENQYLNLAARIIVGLIFIYAGIGKVIEPEKFAKEIFNYSILPYFLINITALIMPWLEVIVGIFLIAGIRIKASGFISSGLMAVFIIAVFSAMVRGLDINCGCFSDKNVMVGWPKIFENLGILILALYVTFFPVNKFTLENLS